MDTDEAAAAVFKKADTTAPEGMRYCLQERKRRQRMVLETKRLLLREMRPDDFQALFLGFGSPETMWHYPYTFDGQHVRDWIERNIKRYVL